MIDLLVEVNRRIMGYGLIEPWGLYSEKKNFISTSDSRTIWFSSTTLLFDSAIFLLDSATVLFDSTPFIRTELISLHRRSTSMFSVKVLTSAGVKTSIWQGLKPLSFSPQVTTGEIIVKISNCGFKGVEKRNICSWLFLSTSTFLS